MAHFFVPLDFASSLPSSISNYEFLHLIQLILPWFLHLIHVLLIYLLVYFFFYVTAYLIHNLKYQIQFQHLLKFLNKYHPLLSIQLKCPCPYNKTVIFYHILILHNHTKTLTLMFHLILALKVLSPIESQVYS